METDEYTKGSLVKIYIVPYKEYLERSSWIIYRNPYKHHPYKWYDLRRFVTLPIAYVYFYFKRKQQVKIAKRNGLSYEEQSLRLSEKTLNWTIVGIVLTTAIGIATLCK